MIPSYLQRLGFLGALLVALVGICLPTYADNSVTFFLSSPSKLLEHLNDWPITSSIKMTSDDGLLIPLGATQLEFGPHTNVYQQGVEISSSNPQRQTGNVTVWQTDPYGKGTDIVRCKFQWTHDFWIGKKGDKHDRFYVTFTEQMYSPESYLGPPCGTHNTPSKSGKTIYIDLSPYYYGSTRH